MLDTVTVLQALSLMEQGILSTVELAERIRDRIDRWEPRIKAFLHIDPAAMESLAEGRFMGPLAGIPIGVKDMIDVAGMPTTGGSQAYRYIPDRDAPCVAGLRAAGAVVVGKTNTQELAYGVVTPPTRNPQNLDHIPGGSSGGSAAAVAAGMVLAALGTDTGGSVRIPASCCGIVGFKPTVGRISNKGVMPLSTTLDHVGVLTLTVSDARLLFHLLDGVTPLGDVAAHKAAPGSAERYPCPGPRNVRLRAGEKSPVADGRSRKLAVPREYIQAASDPEVLRLFEAALEVFGSFGYEWETIDMEPFAEWKRLQLMIRLPEAYGFHREVLEGPKRALLGDDLARRLDPGKEVSAVDYLAARDERKQKIQRWIKKMESYAAVVMPTLPCRVPRVGQSEVAIGGRPVPVWDAMVYLTAPWNVLGFPAVSVPCGIDGHGLPVGVQVIGAPMDDEFVLDLAAQYQTRSGMRPQFS